MEKVDWNKVQFALEPSAGKGDLAMGIRNRMKQEKKPFQLDCVEIDPDLRAVLRERGFAVVENDFLKWDAQTRYDVIVMNPPFRDGDKHLMHALELMKHGGQIVCLLNESTIRNAESPLRRSMVKLLAEYQTTIESVSGAFMDAERKTDVDVALVYVDIPKEAEKEIGLDDMREAADVPESETECNELVDADFFKAIVQRYQMEARIGLKMIDSFQSLNRFVGEREIIRISIASPETEFAYYEPEGEEDT